MSVPLWSVSPLLLSPLTVPPTVYVGAAVAHRLSELQTMLPPHVLPTQQAWSGPPHSPLE